MTIHISFEGLDGTGKSTLVPKVREAMEADWAFHRWVYQTKEPGVDMVVNPGYKIKRPGINIRDIVLNDKSLTPLERELMFYVDASQHRRFINNQQEALILSDRGLWSHYAYLRATLKTGQIRYDEYAACKNIINLICPQPDRVVYLRGSLDLMKRRNEGKQKDLIESNGDFYFQQVLDTYEDLVIDWGSRALVLNAENNVDDNVLSVIEWLKEEFTDEQLRRGDSTLP